MIVQKKEIASLYKIEDGCLHLSITYFNKLISDAWKVRIEPSLYPKYRDIEMFFMNEPDEAALEKFKFALWGVLKGLGLETIKTMDQKELIMYICSELDIKTQEACFKKITNIYDSEEDKEEKEDAFLNLKYYLEDPDIFDVKIDEKEEEIDDTS